MPPNEQAALIQHWFTETSTYTLGADGALALGNKIGEVAQEIVATQPEISGLEAYGEAYSRFYGEVQGPLLAQWASSTLMTYRRIQETDPEAAMWLFARDAYPLGAAMEELAPLMGVDLRNMQTVHMNRNNLGIKDEADAANNEHIAAMGKGEQLVLMKQYAEQLLGDADSLLVVDSWQYAYMLEHMLKGRESIISRLGNVGKIWQNGGLPAEVSNGFIPQQIDVLAYALYSHLSGEEWNDAVPSSLVDLCVSAGIPVTQQTRFRLEALTDQVEGVVKGHKSVRSFDTRDGRITPVVEQEDHLTRYFAGKALDGIRTKAAEIATATGGDAAAIDALAAGHLRTLFDEFDKADRGEPAIVTPAITPSLSKRHDLFREVRVTGTDNYPAPTSLRGHVYKPAVNN